MKKIMVHVFPSLDNYGTAMMGLVTLRRLQQEIGEPIAADCDFFADTDLGEVQDELGAGPGTIRLARRPPPRGEQPWRWRGRAKMVAKMLLEGPIRGYDLVIFLGGDDLSEYYNPHIWLEMLRLRQWGGAAPLVLLGQTIGPFERTANRAMVNLTFPAFHIFPRDRWCTEYLAREFGLTDRVSQSSDLAFADLPRQNEPGLAAQTLADHGLEPDGYVTLVVSAIQSSGYYTGDRDLYLARWQEIAGRLLADPRLDGRRLVLLAHTHGQYYGDEPAYIEALLPRFDAAQRERITAIPQRILPTRARLVLGNGLFTITGRMHPAVSTFQMGKPAIALSYSKKYAGVIGTMLGRADLIVEAGDEALWRNGAVVGAAMEKVDYVLGAMDRLRPEIRAAVATQKQIVDATFARLGALLTGRG